MFGIQQIIQLSIGLIGGLGLFFYGFHISGKSLQNLTSFGFRKLLEKLTKNVFFSLLVGFFITALVQSSSATTVFLVNFINAGLISLTNSMGIIFGANIGSTVTVQFISLSLDQYVLLAIGLGAFLKIFFQKKGVKTLGEILLGFGLIFLGIIIMKDSMMPLKDSGLFMELIKDHTGFGIKNILFGFLISTLITSFIQSSAATLAIVIAMAYTGIFSDIAQVIPFILGAKLGSCMAAILASIKANRDAKRVALAHFTFNLIEAVIVIIFLNNICDLIKLSSDDLIRQIANTHTATSLAMALLILPFTKVFVYFLKLLIPIYDDEKDQNTLFDVKSLETPVVAIKSVKMALLRMANIISRMLTISSDGITHNDTESVAKVFRMEAQIDQLRTHGLDFIMELSKKELNGYQATVLNSYREMANDMERMADHVENIVDSALYKKREKCCLDDYATTTIVTIRDHIVKQFSEIYVALDNEDADKATDILMKSKTDEKDMFRNKILEVNQRIKDGKTNPELGMLLIDIIYNYQRISYHSRRLLYGILRVNNRYDKEV